MTDTSNHVPFFAGLPADHRHKVLAHLAPHTFERCEVICLPGDPGDHAIFVAEGRIDVFETSPAGLHHAGRVERGGVMGLIGLIAGGTRQYAAIAKVRTRVLQLSKTDFRRFLSDEDESATYVLSHLLPVVERGLDDGRPDWAHASRDPLAFAWEPPAAHRLQAIPA